MARNQRSGVDKSNVGKGKTNSQYDKNSSSQSRGRRGNRSRRENNSRETDITDTSKRELVVGGRDNDPNWYFTDKAIADQVSRLSFQQLAGLPIEFGSWNLKVPNLVRLTFNPSPGITRRADFNNVTINKSTGANLAGFRLFSKLSAYTGRQATYGPQDITTMILAMGEVLSCAEWVRRAFGVSYVMSQRNRSYPRALLDWAMLLDADDFFANRSNYRERFNLIITMINQLPIPQGIAYFEKCMSIYQKIYLDQPSSMAQTIVPSPWTTWEMDERSSSLGTVLHTRGWFSDEIGNWDHAKVRTMGDYLDILDKLVAALLNSSSLQTVYTDLLNLANKIGTKFWQLDYLYENYTVLPEYNEHFSLMAHNATIMGMPIAQGSLGDITNRNDVVHNPAVNAIYQCPAWHTLANNPSIPRTGSQVLLDMLTDSPTVEDMVEVTRYTSISGTSFGTFGGLNATWDAIVPDHYVVNLGFYINDPVAQPDYDYLDSSTVDNGVPYRRYASVLSQLDWHPFIYEIVSTGTFTGNYCGDLNFYTVADPQYLRRLHQFMTLGLYDIRS